jgi:hypothetical protein
VAARHLAAVLPVVAVVPAVAALVAAADDLGWQLNSAPVATT